MIPFGLSLGEAIAALTLAYVIALASFNAGYFDRVPSRFVELFSFADLVNANIPILQYIILLYGIYCVLAFLLFIPGHFASHGMNRLVRTFPLPQWATDLLGIGATLGMGAAAIMATRDLDATNNLIFTFEFIPWAVFFGMLFQESVWQYRLGRQSTRTVVVQIIINAVIFCHVSGRMWVKYEVRNPDGVQAMYLQSGECLERKLLRSTSNGYLLYSFDLKQFEFREKSSFKTIYGTKGCT